MCNNLHTQDSLAQHYQKFGSTQQPFSWGLFNKLWDIHTKNSATMKRMWMFFLCLFWKDLKGTLLSNKKKVNSNIIFGGK